jgi:hypothetical protein
MKIYIYIYIMNNIFYYRLLEIILYKMKYFYIIYIEIRYILNFMVYGRLSKAILYKFILI